MPTDYNRYVPGVFDAPRDFGERVRLGLDCDEVYPGIMIATGHTLKNDRYLIKTGVSHVINCCEQDVHASPQRLAKLQIKYKGEKMLLG
jgi:hypothetical protein